MTYIKNSRSIHIQGVFAKKMTLEVLVATMNQKDLSLPEKMNIDCDSVIANQCGSYGFEQKENARMLSTATKGVGVNRNLALSLATADILVFADDDMTYYDSQLEGVKQAFENLPQADAIVFSLDYTKKGEVFDKRRCTQKRLRLTSALKYGACRLAVRKSAIDKRNITFSTLFGGGCIYGSGEDSLFICDLFRAGLTVYSHPYVLGACAKDSSSWFSGYDGKFMFDKGAFIACAFPKSKHFIKWYFAFKFYKKSKLSFSDTIRYMNKGIKAFKKLESFNEI